VGQTATRLCAFEGGNVTVASRSLQKASSVATEINEEFGEERVRGVETRTPDTVGRAIEGAEIIFSVGAAGIRLLPWNVLGKYGKTCKIIADFNAIPPLGIEGLDSNADGVEVKPGTFGIGALTIGKLKNKVEAALIKAAADESKGIFDHKMAYELAKKAVLERLKEQKNP
jgi:methylene-tetrahydromethanopterin dehydrogenase